MRLERSFDREDLLLETLTIAFGNKEIAGLLKAIGSVFRVAGDQAATQIMRKASARIAGAPDWTSSAGVCDIAIEAAITVLESFRPGPAHWVDACLGACIASDFIKSIRDDPSDSDWSIEDSKEVLGPVAERLHPYRLQSCVVDSLTWRNASPGPLSGISSR